MRVGGWWMAGLAVMLAGTQAGAVEIKVLCSNGLRAVMQQLAPEFERASGHKVLVRYGLAAAFKQQIDGGEAFDVVVLTPPLIDDAIKRGLVAADTRSTIGRAGIGVAIRAGGPRPDIGSVEAFTTKDGSTIRELHHTSAQSLAEAALEPGQATERHYHGRTEEIYLVTKGAGSL